MGCNFGSALMTAFLLMSTGLEAAAECPALPYTLTNGQTADATQVMANFNAALECINTLNSTGAANSFQYNAGNGNVGVVGPLSNGQIIVGSTGGSPQAATLTAGPGIAISNGPGTINISATGLANNGPVLVQSAFSRVETATPSTVTLTSAPAVGDILVAFSTGYGGSNAVLTIPSGFPQVASNIANASPYQGVVVGARVVQSGDPKVWSGFSGGSGGYVSGVLEFSGAHAVNFSVSPGSQTGSIWTLFGGSPSNAYTFFVIESDAINNFESIAGANLLYNGTSIGTSANSNHPAVIAGLGAGSSTDIVVNYLNSNFNYSIVAAVAVTQ